MQCLKCTFGSIGTLVWSGTIQGPCLVSRTLAKSIEALSLLGLLLNISMEIRWKPYTCCKDE